MSTAATALSRTTLVLGLLVLATTLLPAAAEAQVRKNRLGNEECLANDFTTFDDVIMTGVATHDTGAGDVYQAICDDTDCWGFSINRGAGVNALTTGVTPGEYTWYVCAWNGSVRKVVANLSGGAALWLRLEAGALRTGGEAEIGPRVVSIRDETLPDDLRRFVARLERLRQPSS